MKMSITVEVENLRVKLSGPRKATDEMVEMMTVHARAITAAAAKMLKLPHLQLVCDIGDYQNTDNVTADL